MEIKGDLRVRRTLVADRRADQGLYTETLAANYAVTRHAHHWLALDPDTANRVVEMPDATTLPLGWKVVVQNTGSGFSLEVRSYDGTFTGTVLKTITFPVSPNDTSAYEIVLIDNGTAAGNWYIIELGDANNLQAIKFVVNFLASDWSAPSGDYRILSSVELSGLAGTGHGRGANPIFVVQEGSGPYDKVMCDRERTNNLGDVELRVVDTAEFDGRVILT